MDPAEQTHGPPAEAAPPPGAAPEPVPHLGPWTRAVLFALMAGVAFAAAQLAVLFTATIGLGYLGGGAGLPEVTRLAQSPYLLAPAETAAALVVTPIAIFFWVGIDRRPLASFGLSRLPGWGRQVLAGALLGALPLLLSLAVYLAVGHLRILGWVHDDWGERLLFLASLAVLSVAVGVAEEVPFRGYLLGTLVGPVGRLRAVLITSALFTLIHIVNPNGRLPLNLLSIFLAGTTLAILRLGTGALWAPIAFHAAYDLVAFALMPSQLVAPLLRLEALDSWLWGGQDRAGAFDVALQAVILGAMWRWLAVREGARPGKGVSRRGLTAAGAPPAGERRL